jgi:membrane protease YdiL (CAAX protease family)
MGRDGDSYWEGTRHPWSCVLFVLPLLAVYEFGLHRVAPQATEQARNGADAWLRAGLSAIQIPPAYGAPCLLVGVLLAWGLLRRQSRPRDQLGVWLGMTVESAAFAVLLFGLSQGLWHLLRHADTFTARLLLETNPTARDPEAAFRLVVSFVGAGVYEEALFRLLLFSGLFALCALAEFPPLWSFVVAAVGSAVLFAGAHHFGPHGEAFHGYVFAFRTFAGLYFAWLYYARGFGVAVGAHSCYDVLVGLLLRQN